MALTATYKETTAYPLAKHIFVIEGTSSFNNDTVNRLYISLKDTVALAQIDANAFAANLDNMEYAIQSVLNSFYDDSTADYHDVTETASMPVYIRNRTYYSNRAQIAQSIIDSGYDLPTSTLEVNFVEGRRMIQCDLYLNLFGRYTDYLQHWDNERDSVFTAVQAATTQTDLSSITWQQYTPPGGGGGA